MTVEVIEEIKKLNERELMSYWIKGEYEEAETYRKLAERARELGLPDRVVETFERLGRESERHGNELLKIYREKYGDKLLDVRIPNVESTHLLGRFWKVEDLEDVLQTAMDGEKLAETIYRKLAEETENPELRETYLRLADIESGHYNSLKALYEWRKGRGLL